jgi:RNA polymerase subunit RPABC4/transcription elongation factor Spt4
MALACSKCGARLYGSAVNCPDCGATIPSIPWYIVLAVVAAIILLMAVRIFHLV